MEFRVSWPKIINKTRQWTCWYNLRFLSLSKIILHEIDALRSIRYTRNIHLPASATKFWHCWFECRSSYLRLNATIHQLTSECVLRVFWLKDASEVRVDLVENNSTQREKPYVASTGSLSLFIYNFGSWHTKLHNSPLCVIYESIIIYHCVSSNVK